MRNLDGWCHYLWVIQWVETSPAAWLVGSVGRALARGLKGPGFSSSPGHVPRWQVDPSPALVSGRGQEAIS